VTQILIVDDDLIFRELLRETIEMIGIRTMSVSSCEEALPIIQETPPDLILLDLQLPGMSGLELIEYLRAHDTYRGIKIVVVTGSTSAKSSAQVQLADRFYVKPVSIQQLIKQIRQLLML